MPIENQEITDVLGSLFSLKLANPGFMKQIEDDVCLSPCVKRCEQQCSVPSLPEHLWIKLVKKLVQIDANKSCL